MKPTTMLGLSFGVSGACFTAFLVHAVAGDWMGLLFLTLAVAGWMIASKMLRLFLLIAASKAGIEALHAAWELTLTNPEGDKDEDADRKP